MIALGLGIACGLLPGARRWQRANRWLNTIGLFTLLASMGIALGGNRALMSSLPTIGLTAAVLAVSAVTGSVLLSLPLSAWLRTIPTGEDGSAAE